MLFFLPAIFLFVLLLEAGKGLVSIEGVDVCVLDIEGVWEGVTLCSFQCILHFFSFFLLW